MNPAPASSVETVEGLSEDLVILTAGRPMPWEVWTSNSYRRVSSADGADGDVLCGTVQRDGQPDLSMGEERLEALVRLLNAIPALLRDREEREERLSFLGRVAEQATRTMALDEGFANQTIFIGVWPNQIPAQSADEAEELAEYLRSRTQWGAE